MAAESTVFAYLAPPRCSAPVVCRTPIDSRPNRNISTIPGAIPYQKQNAIPDARHRPRQSLRGLLLWKVAPCAGALRSTLYGCIPTFVTDWPGAGIAGRL